ncbi:MAG: ATP-binding protein [Leptospiraceae bacterium]|nr:ATP-binding protein [Leptospiraceae bacterium]MCP5510895.1 ATP-binding protein [Leptospiraceae bacterium]
MNTNGTLFFFSGKMGSGKSTLAKEIATSPNTVLISEDSWLKNLYPDEIHSLDDYVLYSARLKPILEDHVRTLLKSGVSVVMDFPGNTIRQRLWFKKIFLDENLPHKLIYLQAEDRLCLERLQIRNSKEPDRAKFDNEEMFHRITKFFQPPTEEEGFHLEIIQQ